MILSPLIPLTFTLILPLSSAWDNSPPECPYPCLPPPTATTNCPPPPSPSPPTPSEPGYNYPPPPPGTPGSGYYYSPPPPGYFPYYPPPSFSFPAPPPPNPILPWFPWYYKTPPSASGAAPGRVPAGGVAAATVAVMVLVLI